MINIIIADQTWKSTDLLFDENRASKKVTIITITYDIKYDIVKLINKSKIVLSIIIFLFLQIYKKDFNYASYKLNCFAFLLLLIVCVFLGIFQIVLLKKIVKKYIHQKINYQYL